MVMGHIFTCTQANRAIYDPFDRSWSRTWVTGAHRAHRSKSLIYAEDGGFVSTGRNRARMRTLSEGIAAVCAGNRLPRAWGSY